VGWAGNIARKRAACGVLVGKLKIKRQLDKRRSRWEDNIEMDLKEIGWEAMEWVHLAHNMVHGGRCN
jgi:hypothetical protein